MAGGVSRDHGLFIRLLATGGFLGYAPLAPGTAGALGCAVLLWFLLPEITIRSTPLSIATYVVSIAAFVALSIWAAGAAERSFGEKDASRIVIDEFAGYLIAVAFLPKTLLVYVTAFLVFRVIDVLKPFPAGRLESIPGGAGIVLDDLVAGLYANILVRIMLLVKGW
jgi:phosphatidylglycerophosphatase A